jgi:orotate phosphoribosyltransferase
MQEYQKEFLEFVIANKVLCFGDYTLKSGRKSPYFFNSGLFSDGTSLARLGEFYASAIQASGLDFDMLFGPAYKGIPLVSSVAIAFARHHKRNITFCFNRKETKDHGEGGALFGAEIKGRVLIIDDVLSAGTSVKLSVNILRKAGAVPAGVAVALDRQERGEGALSAVQETEQRHAIKVINIVTLAHVIEYLEQQPEMESNLGRIREYHDQYGAVYA